MGMFVDFLDKAYPRIYVPVIVERSKDLSCTVMQQTVIHEITPPWFRQILTIHEYWLKEIRIIPE